MIRRDGRPWREPYLWLAMFAVGAGDSVLDRRGRRSRRWPSGRAALALGRRLAAARRARAHDRRAGPSVLLGRDRARAPGALSDDQLAAHGLLVGASGSGKSTTMLSILGDQIQRGRPVVAIDMKGSPEFARQLAGAAAAGRPPAARLDSGRSRALESARPRQRDGAEGHADLHRAVLRAALQARRRALPAARLHGAARRPPRPPGAARRGGGGDGARPAGGATGRGAARAGSSGSGTTWAA